MKRLVKKSVMNIETFKGSLNQLSEEGRNILKLIEDYKFKLDQTCRITSNDKLLTKKLLQKRKLIDMASSQIYSIVFDIDNIDITNEYEDQQLSGTNIGVPKKEDKPKEETNEPKEESKEESKEEPKEKDKEKDKEEDKEEDKDKEKDKEKDKNKEDSKEVKEDEKSEEKEDEDEN